MGNQENVAHIYAWQYGNNELEKKICSRVWDHIYFWWYHEFELVLPPRAIKHINKNNIKHTVVTCLNDEGLLKKRLMVTGHKSPRVQTWPEFFIIRSHQELLNNNFLYQDLILDNKHTWDIWKYPFLSMNGRERSHRDTFIDVLAREDLIDKGLVTYHQSFRPPEERPSFFKYHDGSVLKTRDRFTQQMCSFDFNDDFIYSFLHIPTESYTEGMTITEKTATPMLCKLPFLTVGSRYFHQGLQAMGFEIYDELFDYSFDNQKTDELRIEGLVKNIHFVNNNKDKLSDFYNLLKPKITKNFEHIFDKYISKFEHVPPLVQERLLDLSKEGAVMEGDEGELFQLAKNFTDKKIKPNNARERKDYLWYNYWCADDQGNGFSFKTIIRDLRKYKTNKVVIDGSAEWEPWFDERYIEYVNENNIQTIVISGCVKNQNYIDKLNSSGIKNIKSLHWPTFFLHYATRTVIDSYEYSSFRELKEFYHIDDETSKWPWICMQNRAHLHRCHLIDNIKKLDLQEQGYVTWINGGDERPDFPYKYHDGKQMKLPNDNFSFYMDSYKKPKVYWETLCDFVSEACWETIFITEKTVYPILAKKLFLVCGAYGFHEYMDTLGFQRYDEIFDYSFDKEPNLEKRVEMYAQQMNSFGGKSQKHYVEQYESVYHKIEYNRKRLFEIIKNDKWMPNAVKYQWARIDTDIEEQALPNWQELFLELKKQVLEVRKIA